MSEAVTNARDEILEAAISLFSRKGYAGTGVQEILDAVQLSKPTLYYYFESKAGLFRAILDFAYDESFRLMKAAADSSGTCEEKLTAVAVAMFEFTLQHRDLTRLVFGTVFAAPEEIPPNSLNPAKRRRNLELVLQTIHEGQSCGEIEADHDAEELSHSFLGAVSQRIRICLSLNRVDLDRDLARRIVSLFMNGARKRN